MNHKDYLSDPGIYKLKNTFYYRKNNERVTDPGTLQRISKYSVPPAWVNVWYASKPRCHIQVYGTDSGGKKQYILSEQWIKNAKYTKFNRMKKFIKDLSGFKKKIKLKEVILSRETLIHLLFNLLIDLHIRVGNEVYAENNNTYGLTTLKQKHLKMVNGIYQLHFNGKSNIEHLVTIPLEYNQWFNVLSMGKSKNKPLFEYNGTPVSSEELNDYLKRFMGKEYTCKDFRTYSANMLFISSFLKNSKKVKLLKSGPIKKCVLVSIDESARQLGHTRSISRKSYISENLINYCIDSFGEASASSEPGLLCKVWSC